MTLQHRGHGATDNGAGASTVTTAASAAPHAGDRLLLAVSYRSDSATDPTPPTISGVTWTELPGLNPANGGSAGPDLQLFAWEAIASDGTNSFPVTLPESCKAVAGILAFYDDGGSDVIRSADGGGDGIVIAEGDGTAPAVPTGVRGNGDQYLAGLFSNEGLAGVSENGDLAEDALDASTGGTNGTRNRLTVGHLITASDTASKSHSYTVGSSNAYQIAVVIYEIDAGGAPTTINASAIATPAAVPTDTLALSLDLAASAIPSPAAVTVDTLALSLDLNASAIAAVFANPTASIDTPVVLSAGPIAAVLAVPTDSLDRLLTIGATPIAALVSVPSSTLTAGAPGTISLVADPITAVIAVPTDLLELALTLASSALPVSPAAPSSALDTSLALVAVPIPALLAMPAQLADLSNTLAATPISTGTSIPSGSLGFALTLHSSSIAAILATIEADFGGGDIISGSDHDFIADCLTFWVAFDALAGDQAGQRQLYREFLLTHGGRLVYERGFWTIIGAAEPVRIDL